MPGPSPKRGFSYGIGSQPLQQAGVSASARTVRRRLLEGGLVSRKTAKKPLLSKKNIRDRLTFCRKYRDLTAAAWCKVIFSDEAHFRLFATFGKNYCLEKERCFSSKGMGSLTILPKNTAMNREWYQNILQEQLLPTIEEQFGDEQCFFQHDGAQCYMAKLITKWLGEQNIEILGPWPGNSPDLNPIENLWSILKNGRTNKNTKIVINSDYATMGCQDLAQKLISSMPGEFAEVLKKKGQHCKY